MPNANLARSGHAVCILQELDGFNALG